jgi:hypothetical protein
MGGTRFIVAGGLIDGSGAEVRRKVFLAVKDGVIAAIDSAARLPLKDGVAIDDFPHCIILPPLVDCSVSLSRSPAVDSRMRLSSEVAALAEKTAMLARHIRYCHAYGVLGVADGDEITELVECCRQGMELGRIIDIRTSGGVCRSRLDCGPGKPANGDFLKIGYSADIEDEEGPSPRLDYQDLCRIQRHRDRKKTVVVANGVRQVAEALEAGCDAIEETKLFIKAGHSLEETFRCASENGARFFGMKELGQLTAGRKATFLITRGTVRQLPRKLSYLEAIYVDGIPSIAYRKNPV